MLCGKHLELSRQAKANSLDVMRQLASTALLLASMCVRGGVLPPLHDQA